MKISEFKPLEQNPFKSKGDAQIKAIGKSIQDFSEMMSIRKIVIDEHNEILGGNKRFFALKMLGYTEIPDDWVDKREGLTPAQKREFIVKDNSHYGSEWDFDMLKEWDVDLADFGVEVSFDAMPDISAGDVEEVEADDADTVQTDIQEGDLFQIGEHRLLCGDSTCSDTVAKLMDGEKADMVFTDPPYSITTQGGGALQKHFNKTADRIKDIVDFKPKEWLQTLPLYFNGNMNTFIFCNKDLIPDYLNYAKENSFNFNILVWCKKQVVPFTGGHHYSDIEYIIYLSKKPIFNNGLKNVEYRKYFVLDNEKSKDHPTIKPLEIIANEIQIASNVGGVVAECFTGSGSTMVASHQLKRKCYGMELDPKYCQVIINRMRKLDPNIEVKCLNRDFDPTIHTEND